MGSDLFCLIIVTVKFSFIGIITSVHEKKIYYPKLIHICILYVVDLTIDWFLCVIKLSSWDLLNTLIYHIVLSCMIICLKCFFNEYCTWVINDSLLLIHIYLHFGDNFRIYCSDLCISRVWILEFYSASIQ